MEKSNKSNKLYSADCEPRGAAEAFVSFKCTEWDADFEADKFEEYKNLRGSELLRELCLTFGPSGCEDNVRDKILRVAEGFYDERIRDNMGSLIFKINKRSKAPSGAASPRRLLLSSHMDEVGFIVSKITDDGYLKPILLSGRDTRVWKGRGVLVGNEKRQIKGYVGAKPIHMIEKSERSKAIDADELYIDIGASDRESAEKLVSLGDYGTWDSDFIRFGQDGRMLKGKAIDDRLGCAVMCDIMRDVWEQRESLAFDLYFAFTCKEETGLSGARCAAYKVCPDYAIVFESTAVADIDGVGDDSVVARQGRGGALSLADRATFYDREFTEFIMKTAKEKKIPCQYKKFVSGGNDAGSINRTRAGVRCAALSAPARYIHTASNVVRESDFFAIRSLAEEVISELSKGGIR